MTPGAIGVFGGTFDPVHYGHLRAALEAREFLGLTDFRLLPAGTPPHRATTFAAAQHRLNMLELAISEYSDLTVDTREVTREGFSYMSDTLAEIRQEEGDRSLLLMIGQDAANQLDNWHDWKSLFELAHLVVMRRPESKHIYSSELFAEVQPRMIDNPSALLECPAGLVLPLEVTQLAISSTGIRRQFETGHSPRFLLPDNVISYIREHHLYASTQATEFGEKSSS